ncbi:hypothetical protein EVAR_41984_1 [Eumeta japonica]|uniref:Uncharacterized protein n=1 Tax=Eumeta variegata TaxID=151549 RepID=A0A4C1WLD7_EUMVA|nr:hypothetical protein EVAR_41984_1 [Eumeta japonica]
MRRRHEVTAAGARYAAGSAHNALLRSVRSRNRANRRIICSQNSLSCKNVAESRMLKCTSGVDYARDHRQKSFCPLSGGPVSKHCLNPEGIKRRSGVRVGDEHREGDERVRCGVRGRRRAKAKIRGC